MLSRDQVHSFARNGYLVIPQFESAEFCEHLVNFVQDQLQKHQGPIEYEADTRYPGAPDSRDAEGGKTARRLLGAYSRDAALANWATNARLRTSLQQLLGPEIYLSQCHHNCIMTKHPDYSSRTGWHRDSRYWNFARPELVSAWLALGDEQPDNGCLWVIPGSHLVNIQPTQLNELQFLRTDLQTNEGLLASAIPVPLNRGDLLLFHSNLFHAAGRNTTRKTKYSLVFTYRSADNPPQDGTRSSSIPDVPLAENNLPGS